LHLLRNLDINFGGKTPISAGYIAVSEDFRGRTLVLAAHIAISEDFGGSYTYFGARTSTLEGED
jgi:hypothetical protein